MVVYTVLLVAIPSSLVLSPLGAAGSPAQVVGLLLLVWWLFSVISGAPGRPPRRNPVRWVLFGWVVTVLLSYISGMSRPLLTALEVSSSDRALLAAGAFLGAALVVCDGFVERGRLDVLVRVLAAGAVLIALLGILQFATGVDLASFIRVPGLRSNQSFGQIFDRSSFRRVSGTTLHPIEFGVVLSALLPLVVHLAVHSPKVTERRAWWIAAAVVGAALPMAVARSAILGGAVAFVLVVPALPMVIRRRVLLASVVGASALSFVVPGLLGTLRGLVFSASSDPSTAGRTADYGPAASYFAEHPALGRGIGTFVPSLYRTLDNQLLATLLEGGVVGLLGLLALPVVGAGCGWWIRSHTADPSTRSLALALSAGLMVVGINLATFDALGFPMCASLLFLLLGMTGALWRVGPGARSPGHRVHGRRPRLLVAACLVLVGLAGAAQSTRLVPSAVSDASVLVDAPSGAGSNPFLRLGRTADAASVLRDSVMARAERDELRAQGVVADYQVAVGEGSTMPGSDVIRRGSILRVQVVSGSREDAARQRDRVVAALRARLDELQAQAGVSSPLRLGVELLATADQLATGRPDRVLAASLVLVLLGVGVLAGTPSPTMDRRRRRARRRVDHAD